MCDRNQRSIHYLCTLILLVLSSCQPDDKLQIPIIETSESKDITANSATSGGKIITDNGLTVNSRGVCWGTNQTPSINDSKTNDGAGAGTFVSYLTNLNPGTTYFARAYATNSSGTGYGMAMSFKTLGQAASVIVQPTTNITVNSATLNGTINANYVSTIATFEYGTTSNYGQTVNATQNPIMGNNENIITANVSGLSPGTTYHIRIKTVNSLGTTYSNDLSFITLGQKPIVITQNASNIKPNTADLYGTVNPNLLSTSITFEYGTTTNYGSTVPATPSSVSGNTVITATASISGLASGTNYHYRIKAENQLGTSFGNDISFTTPINVTDIDGNSYSAVVIGAQTWLVENLKTTKLNDGTLIPVVSDNTSWVNLTTPGCCWYNNDMATYKNPYGALYNWPAVITGKLCPIGWHVPTNSEWATLETNLGGATVAGGKMKEIGTTHWRTPNTGATNESGFTLLPSGDRDGQYDGTFWNMGNITYMWSSSEYNSTDAWIFYADYSNIRTIRDHITKRVGLAVRCIKD